LADGLLAPVRGARFLAGHPRLIPLALIPVGLNTLLFAFFFWLATSRFGGWLEALLPQKDVWYMVVLYYFMWVVLVVGLVLMVVFLFTAVANILASPFYDALSSRTEEIVTGRKDDTPFSLNALLPEIGRTVIEELKKIAFYLGIMLLVLALNLIPLIGPILASVLGALVTITWLGFEFLDFNFGRHKMRFGQKMAYVRAHRRQVGGLGLSLMAGVLIPLFNLVYFPMAVVGGTLMFLKTPRS
jgi:CysZ protein